jgi:hypothetical protein
MESIPGISRLRKRQKSAKSTRPDAQASPVRALLAKIPPFSHLRADQDAGMYVHVDTRFPGVEIPQDVLDAHPQTVLIALQHQYEDLRVGKTSFNALLGFSGRKRRVSVPCAAVQRVTDLKGAFDVKFGAD